MIRPATSEDVPRIMDIFAAARTFMRRNGNMTQWAGGYPNEDIVREDIALGECFCIEQDGKVGAVFTLLSRPDPTYSVIYDGAWKSDAPYGTIHRIATNGSVKGVVAKAVQFALQTHSTLRCDTHADNLPMQRALTKAGFDYCGIIHLETGEPRMAYQLYE